MAKRRPIDQLCILVAGRHNRKVTAELNIINAHRTDSQILPQHFTCCWLLLTLLLAGCAAPPPSVPVATEIPLPTPQLQTVEVTRIVAREVVVTATPAPPTACAPATLADAAEVVVGVLAPFSQDAAWPDALAMQAGIGLAVEDVNQAGGIDGKPLRVIMQDTTGDAATAARLADSLVTHDCASALIGGFTNEEAAAIKQVSERYTVPFLIVNATADELTSDHPASVFRLAPTASMIAQKPVQWLNAIGDFNGDGAQQVLLIAENSAAADTVIAQADLSFPAAGIAYDVLRVDTPAEDYSSLIARVVARENAADVIMLYVTGEATLDLLRQLLDAGIGPHKGTLLVAGRAALDGAQFWARVPDGAFTVISRRGPWHTSATAMGQAFADRYQAYSEQWPNAIAFSAYDALHLVADAAQRAGDVHPPALVAALETADIILASGYYHFPYNSRRPPSGPLEADSLWHQWPDPPLLYMQYSAAQQDPAILDIVWPRIYGTVDAAVLRP